MPDGARRVDDDPWLTEREAAQELRVSAGTVRKERMEGALGFARVRGRIFYPMSCIRAYKAAQPSRKAARRTAARKSAPEPKPEPKMARYKVYFARAGDDGPIKIGIARDPLKRVSDLQMGNHRPIRLIAAMNGGRAKERELHARFAEHRMRGEWFKPHPELLAFIQGVPAHA